MRIHDIPYHLRNTVEHLDLPIYIDLDLEECRVPLKLAFGDSLMVLGLIRNQGRPVRLCMNPGLGREIIEAHPLVRELTDPEEGASCQFEAIGLPVQRWGRLAAWTSKTTFPLGLPVLPVDQVRANPILAHSLYYGLENHDDRPSVFVDPSWEVGLGGLLSRRKPTLVAYPLNPGRQDFFWQDPAWWRELLHRLKGEYSIVLVGGRDYGELAQEADVCLSMDDPASNLPALAGLCRRASAFVGRDGGLSHLAAALTRPLLVVWDSMASYRYWATCQANHLIFSNPYAFRYPQAYRLSVPEIKQQVRAVAMHVGDGKIIEEKLPQDEGYEERVAELFGSFANFVRFLHTQQEIAEERVGIETWMAIPELKAKFYADSQEFAARVLLGQEPEGVNWVAPVFP